MTKARAFWLSFFCTLAVLVPLYLAVFAYGRVTTGARAVGESQSSIWVAQAKVSDAHTVLVMTGDGTAQTAQSYTLVRFDAYHNSIAIVDMPPQTVVLAGGKPVTLAEATASAGPSQTVESLAKTLSIPIDNYLFAAPKTLWQMAEAFGNVKLRLGRYVAADALTALGLTMAGGEMQTVSPRLFSQILAGGNLSPDKLCALRACGYSAFLAAGHGMLKVTLPKAVRTGSTSIATNLTATQLYDYERTLQFLDRQEPTYTVDAMPGTWHGDRFDLSEEAVTLMQKTFGGSAGDGVGAAGSAGDVGVAVGSTAGAAGAAGASGSAGASGHVGSTADASGASGSAGASGHVSSEASSATGAAGANSRAEEDDTVSSAVTSVASAKEEISASGSAPSA